MIDDVLERLAAAGQLDSEGEFTMDRAKAREKMRRFQLADPRAYVLELVQAAALKGATRVRFDIDARDMVMELDGRPFTTADFDDIYGAALTRRLDHDVLARRQLALGLSSAMALRPAWIVVESGDGQTGARLRLLPDAEDEYEAIETTRAGTRIHVRERFSMGTFAAFFKNLAGTLAEEQLLRARCGYASFTIDLEGTRIDRGLVLDGEPVLDVVEVEGEHTRVVCGLREDGAGTPSVRIVKDGVWICDQALLSVRFPRGFVAVAQDHAVRKDVSQSHIVKDDAYEQMLRVVAQGCRLALVTLAERQLVGTAPPWAEHVLVQELHELVRVGSLRHPDEPTGLGKALRRLPLWNTTAGQPLCLDDLFAEDEAHGSVGFTSLLRFGPIVPPKRSFVVFSSAADPEKGPEGLRKQILAHVLGTRLRDVGAQLDVLWQREQARRAWRARPNRPVLPEGAYLCRRAIEVPGVRGELGIAAEQGDHASLAFVVDGCTLADERLELPWLGLRMVVAADCFRPDATFQRIARTREACAALLHVAVAIPDLYADLARVPEATPWRDACAMSFLASALRGDSLATILSPTFYEASRHREEAIAAFGAARLRLDPGLTGGKPHPIVGMPLLRMVGSRRMSLQELLERARRGEPIRAVAETKLDVEADILVLDAEERALLQPLLSRPIVDGSAEVTRLQRERIFLARPAGPPGLAARPSAVLVPIEGEGITGVLQVVPKQGMGLRSITVLHRQRPIDTLQLVMAGECAGWIEPTDVTPAIDYRYVKDDAALDRARAAVLRAFAAACLRVAERCRAGATDEGPSAPRGADLDRAAKEDAAFLVEVLGLPFPGASMRAAYDHLRGAKGATPERMTEAYQRLYAAMHVQRDAAPIEDRVARLSRSKIPMAEVLTIPAPTRAHGWALAAVDVLFPPGDRPHDLARRVLRPVAPLGELPLLRRHDGRPLVLAELREVVERHQTVLHTHALAPVDLGDRLAVLVDAAQLETLRRVAGRRWLLDGNVTIAQTQRRQALASRAKAGRIALAPGAALVSVRLDGTKSLRAYEGEVGLASDHPGNPLRTPGVRLRAHVARVEIEVLELPDQPAHLVAAVNDDHLQLAPDHAGLLRNKALDELVALCHARVPELMILLAAQWGRLAARRAAWYHVLDFLVAHPPAALEAWVHPEVLDEAFAKAAAIGGFLGVGGVPLSAAQLASAHLRNGRLDVLPAPWTAWGTSPLPPERPVACVDAYELDALRFLLPRVENVEGSWPRWRDRERNRSAAPPARVLPDPRVLVWQEVAADGLQGRVAIPVAGEPMTIELCADGKVMAARSLEGVLPCWGSVSGALVQPDDAWTDAIVDEAAIQALRTRSLELYGKLARWLVAHDDHAEHGRVATMLAEVVVMLARAERTGPLPEPKARLLRELGNVRVLPLSNGRRISLHAARKEQPGELAHLDLWDGPGHRLQQRFAEVASPPPPAEPEPAPPAMPTPEERLVDALRAELRLVREHSERLLSDLHLDRLHVRPLTGAARGLVAFADARGVIVDRDHPVVRRALAEPTDPMWCTYVASAVYTALNVQLAEITDADERKFLELLAELAASH